MAYIISLFLLAFLFLAMHFFTQLTKTHKISITTLAFLIIYSAIAYNTHNNNKRKKLLNVVTKFYQNKSVKCNGVEVNSSKYSLSIGTYTFIGKKNTPIYGQMISASICK